MTDLDRKGQTPELIAMYLLDDLNFRVQSEPVACIPAGMRLDRLMSFALSLPHATVVKQWGECLVYKIAGKMFLILALDGSVITGVTFKCTPEEFDELTETDGIVQAPYCAKRMWAQVQDLAALPEAELNARIRHSYDLVIAGLPKKTQFSLAAPRG